MALSTIPTRALSEQGINFRNLIINGDMSIAQRATSVSSITNSGYKTVDRFRQLHGGGATFTQSQSTDVPSGYGFASSLKIEATTGDGALSSSEYHIVQQKIEGQNVQLFKYGTSSAENITLSFWVKATVTGTYVIELESNDHSRSISQSYTISTTNTWEKKTLTFSGDTSNTPNNDNGTGFSVNWWLGAGSDWSGGTLQTTWGTQTSANRAVGCTNAFASNNDTVYITGVQLEVGTTASDFEFLPYDVNLRRCQRYYEENGGYVGFFSSNSAHMKTNMIVPKRTQSPSISWSNSPMTVVIYGNGADSANSGSSGTDQRSIVFSNDNHHVRLLNMTGGGTGDGKGCFLTDDTYVKIDAEL